MVKHIVVDSNEPIRTSSSIQCSSLSFDEGASTFSNFTGVTTGTITIEDSSGNAMTLSNNIFTTVVMGPVVFFTIRGTITSKGSASGEIRVSGFPYPPSSFGTTVPFGNTTAIRNASGSCLALKLAPNLTYGTMVSSDNSVTGNPVSSITASDFNSGGGTFNITGSYIADLSYTPPISLASTLPGYTGTFTECTTTVTLSATNEVISDPTYKVWRKADGGNWYVIVYGGVLASWTAYSSTTDPNTWVPGNTVTLSGPLAITATSITQDGKSTVSNADPDISYT